jgi:hypothetical protein
MVYISRTWLSSAIHLLLLEAGHPADRARFPPFFTLGDTALNFNVAQCVSGGYTPPMKDSGLRIRIERELREKFLDICRKQDRPAAQVIREFMRTYINENDNVKQNKKKKEA